MRIGKNRKLGNNKQGNAATEVPQDEYDFVTLEETNQVEEIIDRSLLELNAMFSRLFKIKRQYLAQKKYIKIAIRQAKKEKMAEDGLLSDASYGEINVDARVTYFKHDGKLRAGVTNAEDRVALQGSTNVYSKKIRKKKEIEQKYKNWRRKEKEEGVVVAKPDGNFNWKDVREKELANKINKNEDLVGEIFTEDQILNKNLGDEEEFDGTQLTIEESARLIIAMNSILTASNSEIEDEELIYIGAGDAAASKDKQLFIKDEDVYDNFQALAPLEITDDYFGKAGTNAGGRESYPTTVDTRVSARIDQWKDVGGGKTHATYKKDLLTEYSNVSIEAKDLYKYQAGSFSENFLENWVPGDKHSIKDGLNVIEQMKPYTRNKGDGETKVGGSSMAKIAANRRAESNKMKTKGGRCPPYVYDNVYDNVYGTSHKYNWNTAKKDTIRGFGLD